MRFVRSASELPTALMCSTSMACFLGCGVARRAAREARDFTRRGAPPALVSAQVSALRAQEAFEQRRQRFRLVVVQHVAGR